MFKESELAHESAMRSKRNVCVKTRTKSEAERTRRSCRGRPRRGGESWLHRGGALNKVTLATARITARSTTLHASDGLQSEYFRAWENQLSGRCGCRARCLACASPVEWDGVFLPRESRSGQCNDLRAWLLPRHEWPPSAHRISADPPFAASYNSRVASQRARNRC